MRDSAVAKVLHDQTAVAEHVHHVANVDLADLRNKRKCEYELSLFETTSNLLHLLSLFISIGTRISLTDKQIVVVLGSQEGVIVEDLWECTL